MAQSIYYWPVSELPPQFPVHIHKCTTFDPYDGCSLHWHEQMEFYYVEKGGIRLSVGGEEQWVSAGDIVFINWCEPHHSIEFLYHTVHYILQIDLSLLCSYPQDIIDEQYINELIVHGSQFQRFLIADPELGSLFQEIIAENNNRQPGYEMAIKGNFLKVFCLLFRRYYHAQISDHSHDHGMRYTRNILIYISHHYAEDHILDTLSKKIGLSKDYLNRVFHSNTGCSISCYIKQFRCRKAMALITEGVSVTQAAMEVGYSDYNYFSRVFRQVNQLSPSSFAKSCISRTHLNDTTS